MNTAVDDDGSAHAEDVWRRLLAGQDAPEASAEAQAQARELRSAFLLSDEARVRAAASRPGMALDPGRAWSALRERARREGLIEGAEGARDRWLARLPAWVGAASGARAVAGWGIATALVVLVLGTGVQWRVARPGDVEVLRSASNSVTLKARDALDAQAAIAAALRKAGASANVYQRPATRGIDVDWLADRTEGVRSALAHWHIVPPAGATSIRIEIMDAD
ncbi:MAG TPA: hypothetical protein VH328_07900 [Burkholderiaceae bacterium]|nr:hypothetical protein [Burkholderiaceae bacterium]